MTIEEWAEDFKSYVNALDMPKDDYNGIMEYIDDVLFLLKEQEAVPITQREIAHMIYWCCGSCGVPITSGDKFCRNCGKAVKWE